MLHILEELSSTSSRNDKIDILKNLCPEDEKMFKKIAYLAYSPSVDFYIREFDQSMSHEECVTLSSALYDLENVVAKRMITGNMAKQWIEQQYEMLSQDDAEVFKRIIKRDLRIGMNAKSINKVFPETIYEHPYMRCSTFSEKSLKNISYPCYSQTKMDGLYCDIMVYPDRIEYRTRNGSYLNLNQKLFDAKLFTHAKNSVLMGECLALDEQGEIMPRSESNGYINSNSIDVDRVVFYIWDAVPLEDFMNKKCTTPYHERLNAVDHIIHNIHSDRLKMVDTEYCEEQQDIMDHFREKREEGEEGTIIKDSNGIWKPGTSKDQTKLKVVFECEMKAVGYKEGTGKNEGKLGAITFQSSDGLVEVSVGTGYKDSDRETFWNDAEQIVEEGWIATIRANDVVSSESREDVMSLFLPRFIEWRKDKTDADSKDRIDEQVASFTDALKMIK
jgi:hypothetical protein